MQQDISLTNTTISVYLIGDAFIIIIIIIIKFNKRVSNHSLFSLLSNCIRVNYPSFLVNTSSEQKEVCCEAEAPHQVPLHRAARRQPPALYEGMHAVPVSERMKETDTRSNCI